MNGTKIPNDKMDAISLATSSFGVQPYPILIIENRELLEKIKPIAYNQPQITEASALLVFAAWDTITKDQIGAYSNQIDKNRNVGLKSLKPVRDHSETQFENSNADNLVWNSKQAYIALGVRLVAAAEEKRDSTLMKGFDKDLLDNLLHLIEKGLQSAVIMTLGYRDDKNDYLVNFKKN